MATCAAEDATIHRKEDLTLIMEFCFAPIIFQIRVEWRMRWHMVMNSKFEGHRCEQRAYTVVEMVHAYDQLRWKMEWSNNLRHAACAEIRASSLSGECRWTREFFGNHIFKIAQQHQECVRRRATLSLRARPDCRDDLQAAQMVNEVWDSCFADTRPFDDIYR